MNAGAVAVVDEVHHLLHLDEQRAGVPFAAHAREAITVGLSSRWPQASAA